MKRIKLYNTLAALLIGGTLLQTACAQNPHAINATILMEQSQIAKSTVVLNNEQQVIPLQNLDMAKVASVHFSYAYATAFDSILNKYVKVQAFNGNPYSNLNVLSDDLKLYNTIIVSLTDAETGNPQFIDFINSNQKLKNVIVVVFGKGKALGPLDGVNAPVVWSEKQTALSASYSAQVVFGGIAATQKLGSNFSAKYRAGTGFTTVKTRLQYTVPEDAGVNSNNLTAIDDIAAEAIRERATPGCVVIVAKDGKVIFNKAYGYHTYENAMPDKITDIFDLASMTKVSATTMEAMRLTGEGKMNLDSTLGYYIAKAKNTNKSNITVRSLLLHEAGLIPDIATFTKVKPADHAADSSAAFPTRVNDGYYLRKNYWNDVMYPDMFNSPLRTPGKYVYSDLSMLFMKEVEENITQTPLNVYVQKQFYTPLGMQTAGFLPLYRFGRDQIIPTEDDRTDRHALLHGDVHDPTAALLGGVAGHAGLFASANDVAILYQMVLNGGTYGGTQYLKPEIIKQFTVKYSANSRRGLGFDRWDPDLSLEYPSKLASPETFGHTGYTGTCIWVDPKSNLVYIFLSNRVHPKVSNKLSTLKVRGRIQDAIYGAIAKGL
ncbi:MAG: serine hydrolase [Mucilaginibacter sp.]|uniref:serine hydrolase domain-containing protein n=1 Tax=Mucilaginibacter sp. TaxID=1882438 RepID=UPI00326710A9